MADDRFQLNYDFDAGVGKQVSDRRNGTGIYAPPEPKPEPTFKKKWRSNKKGFDVNEFTATLGGSLARPSSFRVTIGAPFIQSEEMRYLAFLCNQAQLPARQFATLDYTTHGPIMKIPYQNMYDDVVMSFFCREDMEVKSFFQQWQNKICRNHEGETGTNEFQYMDDYVARVGIVQYDQYGNQTYVVQLIDAYPMMVSPLQTDWSTRDGFHNLQVTFAYRFWQESIPQPSGQFIEEYNPKVLDAKLGDDWLGDMGGAAMIKKNGKNEVATPFMMPALSLGTAQQQLSADIIVGAEMHRLGPDAGPMSRAIASQRILRESGYIDPIE